MHPKPPSSLISLRTESISFLTISSDKYSISIINKENQSITEYVRIHQKIQFVDGPNITIYLTDFIMPYRNLSTNVEDDQLFYYGNTSDNIQELKRNLENDTNG